jgi:Cdc6-like AAA superfamily ATPase
VYFIGLESQEKIFDVPYQPTSTFVERQTPMEALIKQFRTATLDLHPPRFVLLHGIRGAGKTQITLKYAFNNRLKYSIVLWIDASSTSSVTASFQAIIQNFMSDENSTQFIMDAESVKKNFMDWLDKRTEEWLVILDNADKDDLRHIQNIFAGVKKGHIILTTRQKDVKRLTTLEPVLVEGMEKDEALQIFIYGQPSQSLRQNFGRSS